MLSVGARKILQIILIEHFLCRKSVFNKLTERVWATSTNNCSCFQVRPGLISLDLTFLSLEVISNTCSYLCCLLQSWLRFEAHAQTAAVTHPRQTVDFWTVDMNFVDTFVLLSSTGKRPLWPKMSHNNRRKSYWMRRLQNVWPRWVGFWVG